jgi:fumarate reductase subunit C
VTSCSQNVLNATKIHTKAWFKTAEKAVKDPVRKMKIYKQKVKILFPGEQPQRK